MYIHVEVFPSPYTHIYIYKKVLIMCAFVVVFACAVKYVVVIVTEIVA